MEWEEKVYTSRGGGVKYYEGVREECEDRQLMWWCAPFEVI